MSTENLNLSIENDQLTLYKVSLNGDVHGLETLLQADELILDRVFTLTSFNETPLHIAAMRNHLHFAKVILARKTKLAHELDSFRRLPLHLASAEGYVDIVKELLHVNPDHACFARDGDGRIPLHLAAMKGRIEVIKEFVKICPNSIRENAENGETILHLCVKYNQLEALKLLVEKVKEDDDFVNASDDHCNTILHLASIFKQVEIVKYLISDTSMKTKANALNINGFTALDVVEHTPRDSKSLEIQIILVEAGVQRNKTHNINNLRSPISVSAATPTQQGCCFITRKCKCIKNYYKNVGRKLEEARGNILVAATVIATLAYQAGVSPPEKASGQGGMNTTEAALPSTGQPESYNTTDLLLYDAKGVDWAEGFWFSNTLSMMLSLVIILLMFSGLPFRSKFSSFLLLIIICFTVVHVSQAYFCATTLNFPQTARWSGMAQISLIVLGTVIPFLFYFIIFLHVFSFLILIVRKMWKWSRKLIVWLCR